jgi:leucine dehydrogenase
MNVFDSSDFDHHETVAFFDDAKTGLRALISIHSTVMGPACGGTRMYPYATPDAALTDVLRLSRGMSYKNAIADLPLGGGKAVIIGDPAKDKSEARFAAYAGAVNVGVVPADMPVIARHTKYAAGFDQPGKAGGDSGPATALGVFSGLKAAVKYRLKTDTTKDMRVAIQGLGKVGMGVARRLHAEGAKLIVADVNPAAVKTAVDTLGARAVPVDEIMTVECDVISPNALGAILNDKTVPALHAKVVAGGANNQLARDVHGAMLRDRGILYAPDYVINGGGIIRVAAQIENWTDAEVERRVLGIADTLTRIFQRADTDNAPTSVVADRMARERIARGAKAATKAAE